jgi:hypothetical protein
MVLLFSFLRRIAVRRKEGRGECKRAVKAERSEPWEGLDAFRGLVRYQWWRGAGMILAKLWSPEFKPGGAHRRIRNASRTGEVALNGSAPRPG